MDEQGRIGHYKSRLVAKGFVQKDLIDCEETLAPAILFDVPHLIVRSLHQWAGVFIMLTFPLLS